MIYSRRGFLCSLAATAAGERRLRQALATTVAGATLEIRSNSATDGLSA